MDHIIDLYYGHILKHHPFWWCVVVLFCEEHLFFWGGGGQERYCVNIPVISIYSTRSLGLVHFVVLCAPFCCKKIIDLVRLKGKSLWKYTRFLLKRLILYFWESILKTNNFDMNLYSWCLYFLLFCTFPIPSMYGTFTYTFGWCLFIT